MSNILKKFITLQTHILQGRVERDDTAEQYFEKTQGAKEAIMEINGKKVIGNQFAYDDCHKIYICESDFEAERLKKIGYKLYPIEKLKTAYHNSCDLRFIRNAKLDKIYVGQFETAIFKD